MKGSDIKIQSFSGRISPTEILYIEKQNRRELKFSLLSIGNKVRSVWFWCNICHNFCSFCVKKRWIMYQENKGISLLFKAFSAWPLPTFEKCQMKLCTKLCTNPNFGVFSVRFLLPKKQKNPHPKVRKKLENKGKTGTLRFPFNLVWVTGFEPAASTTPR